MLLVWPGYRLIIHSQGIFSGRDQKIAMTDVRVLILKLASHLSVCCWNGLRLSSPSARDQIGNVAVRTVPRKTLIVVVMCSQYKVRPDAFFLKCVIHILAHFLARAVTITLFEHSGCNSRMM